VKRLPLQITPQIQLLKRELASTRIRYEYCEIRVLLNREGWKVGKKLAYRLYWEEGLGLRVRSKARRTASEHSRRQNPRAESLNHVWRPTSSPISSATAGDSGHLPACLTASAQL
jgi:hypothetical protein